MNKNIKLASWNVNSLKVRLEQVKSLLKEENLDILALQETKLVDAEFPTNVFQEMGYEVSFSGQKTYNGVAIISRKSLKDINTEIPLFTDPQRRLIAATINDIRVINLYVPNGSSLESDKYIYKLNWLENITQYIKKQLSIYPKLAVVGDFNIAPEDCDVHDIQEWQNTVLVSKPERQALQKIFDLNLFDSFRKFTTQEKHFSWWDYRAASFRRDRGLRIDLILLSEPLLKICTESKINREYRAKERPSDHAPVITTLDLFPNQLQRVDCEETRSAEPECTRKYMRIRAPNRRSKLRSADGFGKMSIYGALKPAECGLDHSAVEE